MRTLAAACIVALAIAAGTSDGDDLGFPEVVPPHNTAPESSAWGTWSHASVTKVNDHDAVLSFSGKRKGKHHGHKHHKKKQLSGQKSNKGGHKGLKTDKGGHKHHPGRKSNKKKTRGGGKSDKLKGRKAPGNKKRVGEGPQNVAEPRHSHCGHKSRGKVTHYKMTTTNRQRTGKKQRGKVSMDVQTMRSVIGFKVTDVGQGCIRTRMMKNFKQMKYRGGLFPQKSRKFHMMAHWLRMIEITSYAAGSTTTDKHGHEKKGTRRMVNTKQSMAVVGLMRCKLGFLQSKEGHVLSIFHERKANASCKKIKTTMAEAFESYYFQNGLRQYHTMGRDNGKLARQMVTVSEGGGELIKVCRKTARSARRSKVGPGGHKGRKALKVGKGYMVCCNHYNRQGSMRMSTCYVKQRPGRGGLSQLTKNRKTPKWKRKLKNAARRIPKSKRAVKPKSHFHTHGLKSDRHHHKLATHHHHHHHHEESAFIQEHAAESFDVSADNNLEDMFGAQEDPTLLQSQHPGHYQHSGGYPGKGKMMRGQPAFKGNGNQFIRLVGEHAAAPALKEFTSSDEALVALREVWGGTEVQASTQRTVRGANLHSNKDGWADISPVTQQEYIMAAHRLETEPKSDDTYNQLVDMYQRDHRAVDAVIDHAVKHQHRISPEAKQMAVNALQGAADNDHAQDALAKLITTPGFEMLAAETTHSIEDPRLSIVEALESKAFEGGHTSEAAVSDKQCSNLLALGAAVGGLKNAKKATSVMDRLTNAALLKGNSDCFIRALNNAGEAASPKHSKLVMVAAANSDISEERRAELMAALTYMSGNRIDSYLLDRFRNEKSKAMRFLAAKVLAERDNGRATEKAIEGLAGKVKQMPEYDEFTMALKGMFKSRLKTYHSPAAVKLLLAHSKTTQAQLVSGWGRRRRSRRRRWRRRRYNSRRRTRRRRYNSRRRTRRRRNASSSRRRGAYANGRRYKNKNASRNTRKNASGKARGGLSESLRLDRCSLFEGKRGKLSCERGIVKCVRIMGKKIGCIGGSAFAYLNYNYGYMRGNARAAAGFRLEFFKWGVKLFDTDNKVWAKGASGSVNVYAKYFNIKRMRTITIYSYNRSANYNTRGSNCKANQQTKWSKTKTVNKTFFRVELCYGLPKIASICGAAALSGSMGLRMGFGLIAPSYDAVLLNLRPQAALSISLEVSGQLLGFKGYVRGTLVLVEAKLPASAIFEFKRYRKGGVYLGWQIDLLKANIKAGVQFPSFLCKEEEVTASELDQVSNAKHPMLLWGHKDNTLKAKRPSTELLLEDMQTPTEQLVQVGAGWGRRRRRFFKAIGKAFKKVGKAIVKVGKAIVKVVRSLVKCHNIYGPKTIFSFPGKKLTGTIYERNPRIPCKGSPAPNGFNGSVGVKHSKGKRRSSRRRRTRRRRGATNYRRRRWRRRRHTVNYRRRRWRRRRYNYRRRRWRRRRRL